MYNFRHIDRTNGVLHNVVTAISQDKKGYIWIGTTKGLQRYDGLRFKNYDNYRDSIALQAEIQGLYAAGNSLWLTTTLETERLDINTTKVVRHFSNGETAADASSKYDTYTDWDGNKYLADDFEVYKYSSQYQKMVLYVVSAASPFTTSYIAKDKKRGQAWVISPQGLLLADSSTKRIYSASHNEINDPILLAMKGKSASGIMIDSRHNTWITSRFNDQLYKYDPAEKKLFVYSLFNIKKAQGEQMNESILYNNCVFEDDHSNIWVATRQAGLIKYNSRENNFDYVLAAKSDNQSIEYNYNINCIFQDDQENIWVGTDKGINVFNPYKNSFQTIQHQKNNAASLPQNEILGFTQDDSGDILIATWGGGISIYDSTLKFRKNISIAGTYEANMVWCLLPKDEKNIWAGCQHGFLHTYNTATKEITTIHPAVFENSTIRCMQKDQDGNIWFGLHNGKIAKWDGRSNLFEPYNDDTAAIIRHFSPVRNIFIDNSKNIWASTAEGLKRFDPAQRTFTATYIPDKKNKLPASAPDIQGIEQYNENTLLIGTADDGLYFFNIKNKSFMRPKASDGLPAGSVYAIKKDSAGAIWLTTEYNLYKLKPGKGCINYAVDPDIINSSFERLQFYPLRDGRWITATSTEVFLFNPGSLARINERSKIAITGLKVYDRPIAVDSILDAAGQVPLTYQQNFITIEFSAFSFLNTGMTRYQYRLSGIDKDWVNANGDGFASYTDLTPGHYIFSVRSDADDAPVTSVTIIITPPWYREWWFICICIMAAAFLAYRLVKMRERGIKTQMKLDRQQYKMAEAEMSALRAQMNPHFLFNSLNSINNYILKNDADNAAGYLTKFSRLMRLILDNSRNNWVWLQSELKALQLYAELEAFRFDNNFTYKINIDGDLNAEHIMVPPMIIQPYVENAIWHGLMHRRHGDGHLQIDIYKEDETLCIIIKDNGVGREAANRMRSRYTDKQKSHGMKITSERLEIMNKVYGINAKVMVSDAVENGSDETGTIVSIKFRYTLEKSLTNI